MKIFYDQTGLRWKVVKITAWASFTAWLFMASYFVLSIIFIQPAIINLNFAQRNLLPGSTEAIQHQEIVNAARLDFGWLMEETTRASAIAPEQSQDAYSQQTMAYYIGDRSGLASLELHMSQIDVLLPLWLGLDSSSQSLLLPPQNAIQTVTELVRVHLSDMQVMPVISNYDAQLGDWNAETISAILNDEAKQNKLIGDLVRSSQQNGWSGVSFDLENIAETDHLKYIAFLEKVKESFQRNNLVLSLNLPINNPKFDYDRYVQTADFVLVRIFDEHWLTSEPGPIASQQWFQDKVTEIATKIPNEKLVISLGAMGYDWTEGVPAAQTVSYSQAIQLATASNAEINFKAPDFNTHFDYIDENGAHHYVYLLDSLSFFNQRNFASIQNPKGIAIWKLGAEDSSVWPILRGGSLGTQLDSIKTIEPLQTVDYVGVGDILKVEIEPQAGIRNVIYDDALRAIIDVQYVKLPSGYIIGREGLNVDKQVSLTFNGGPDPKFTPQILKVLKDNDVKATFFVLGSKIEQYPELLKQITSEGHLVGNHTYTRSDISKVSSNQLMFELNSTQLLIESILNKKTILFRPPFDAGLNPQNLEQTRPLKLVSDAGYLIVGNSIDPNDGHETGADKLVTSVLGQAEENNGGVVLLHDSWGDRTPTVDALPLMISELRNKGFNIVPLNEMMGASAAQFNPPLDVGESISVAVNRIFVSSVDFSLFVLKWLIIIGLLVGVLRYFPIGIMALIQKRRHGSKNRFSKHFTPRVSVIIAAYNEEKVIKETIDNVLESDYDKDKYEVVVVDDGSTDGTWSVLLKHFRDHPIVKIYNQRNGGKSSAVNYGISQATGEIMVSQDADTLIGPQTIKLLVRHFTNPRVGAVAGNAKVGNRQNLLTKFQALEYITNQNLDKRAFDVLNAITVVPGAIGAWRMDVIRELGGLDDSTLAEDSDLTLRIIQAGHIVHFEEGAVAYTEAPTTLKTFAAQRFRWAFGTLQVLKKNRQLIANPKYKWLGMIGLPNVIFFQFLSPLVTPIVDLLLFFQVIWVIAMFYTGNINAVTIQGIAGLFLYYIIFTLLDIASSILAFAFEKRENWKLLLWVLPQRLFYRFFLNWICIKSLVTAVKGNAIGWNKLERKGNLKSASREQMAVVS